MGCHLLGPLQLCQGEEERAHLGDMDSCTMTVRQDAQLSLGGHHLRIIGKVFVWQGKEPLVSSKASVFVHSRMS